MLLRCLLFIDLDLGVWQIEKQTTYLLIHDACPTLLAGHTVLFHPVSLLVLTLI